ncbi:MAG: histidine phosphatase family protein [Herpetosiphon sp.]
MLVRHGQASFLAEDYDRLSAIGQEQARELGRTMVALGWRWDRVLVGPRLRHAQNLCLVAEAYQEQGLAFPEAEPVVELDEHHGQLVTELVLPQLAERDPEVRALLERVGVETEESRHAYLRLFQSITRRWVRGEIDPAEHESWATFRQRVNRAIDQIMSRGRSSERVVAFTSGGPVAVATGRALGLDDEQIIQLSWIIRNASYSEYFFSGERFGLSVFNAATALDRPELWTYV